MYKKYLVLALIVLTLNLTGGRLLFAQTQSDQDAKEIQKIKTKVAKYGTGEKAKVWVQLRNQTKIKGFISAIDADSFTVTDKKTGTTTAIDYAQVKNVSRSHISTTGKIIFAVAVAVPVTIFMILFGSYNCNEHAC